MCISRLCGCVSYDHALVNQISCHYGILESKQECIKWMCISRLCGCVSYDHALVNNFASSYCIVWMHACVDNAFI